MHWLPLMVTLHDSALASSTSSGPWDEQSDGGGGGGEMDWSQPPIPAGTERFARVCERGMGRGTTRSTCARLLPWGGRAPDTLRKQAASGGVWTWPMPVREPRTDLAPSKKTSPMPRRSTDTCSAAT